MSAQDRRRFLQQTGGAMAAWSMMPDLSAQGMHWEPRAKVKVAVVGAGRQGREIIAELAKFEQVEVAAVCELDARRLKRGLRRVRGAKGYGDWKEMLSAQSDISAVFVATPTHLHKDLCIGLLNANKHIYCEGPMAGTVDSARELAKAAIGAKTIFQVGHTARSNPVYKLARSFYRSGSIDQLVGLRTQWHRKTSWRTPTNDPAKSKAFNWRLYKESSSGLPGEQGSHLFDSVHYFTKKLPTSVRAMGSLQVHDDGREIFDTVFCQYQLPEKVVMSFDATLANSYESAHETFVGTMGTIRMARRFGWLFKEADAPVQGWEVYANRQQFHDERGITLIADATKLAKQGKLEEGVGLPYAPLHYALESFLQSVTEEKKVKCTAQDGLIAAVIGIKGHEATLSQAEVPIPASLFKL